MNDNAVIKSMRFRTWSYRFAEEVLNSKLALMRAITDL